MPIGDSYRTVLKYIEHRWFSGIGTIAVTALVVLSFPPIVLSAEPDIGSITAARGSVILKRPGAEGPITVKAGVAFKVGDVVEAGENSTVQLTLTDDSFMNLAPNAAVRVNQYSFDHSSNRRTTIIRVIEGKTRFVIYKLRSPGSSFRVEAGNTLVTTGGFADFVVLALPGRSEVVALESSLNVRNTLPYVVGNVNVGVNQRTIIREKASPIVPVIIAPQERKEWLKDVKGK